MVPLQWIHLNPNADWSQAKLFQHTDPHLNLPLWIFGPHLQEKSSCHYRFNKQDGGNYSNFQHFLSRTKITPTLVILIAYVHTQGQDTTQCEILHQTLLGAHHLSRNWRSVTNLPPSFNTAPDNQDPLGGTDWWRTLPNPESQLLMSRHVINYTTVFCAPVQHVAAWGWDFKNANLKKISPLSRSIFP